MTQRELLHLNNSLPFCLYCVYSIIIEQNPSSHSMSTSRVQSVQCSCLFLYLRISRSVSVTTSLSHPDDHFVSFHSTPTVVVTSTTSRPVLFPTERKLQLRSIDLHELDHQNRPIVETNKVCHFQRPTKSGKWRF